jgi:mannan polymerase II complex MNN10 subunit
LVCLVYEAVVELEINPYYSFPLNTGSVIFRATPWMLEFFQAAWKCGTEHEDPKPSEQDCMRDLILNNTIRAGEKTVAVQQWKLNAFPEEIKCYDKDQKPWARGMFVVHFAGAWAHLKDSKDPVGDLMQKYSPQIQK